MVWKVLSISEQMDQFTEMEITSRGVYRQSLGAANPQGDQKGCVCVSCFIP